MADVPFASPSPVQLLLQEPGFWGKAPQEQRTALEAADPRFGGLDDDAYQSVVERLAQKYRPKSPLHPGPTGDMVGQEKARIVGGMKDLLIQAGYTPQEALATSARIGGGLPGTATETLGLAIPPIVGALVPGGRTFSRVGGQILGNVLGRGALEAGMAPEGHRLEAGLRGGLRGFVPGVAQGAVSWLAGSTKKTLQTQKAIQKIQEDVSEEVGAVLSPKDTGRFWKRSTPKEMTAAAGKNLDEMERDIGARLKDQRFAETSLATEVPSSTFEQIRGDIKRLRKLGDRAWELPPGKEAVAARKAKEEAARIEQSLVQQMPADVARDYLEAIRQHAIDMSAVRFVKGWQQREAVTGGANPFDLPGLGEAEQMLSPLRPGAVAHGAVGAIEAATGPRMGAAYHGARFLDALRRGYAGKVAEHPVDLRKPGFLGMLGGMSAETISPEILQQLGLTSTST